jgi:tRNA 2-thiouridine synthesizing protein D
MVMADKKSLTFVLMDAPFEQARTTTAFRLLDIAVRRGYDLTVFCYEGAAALSFAKQTPHANTVHGRDITQEDHPLPRDWVAALLKAAEEHGAKLTWINCGLCVDERGVNEAIPGTVRGSPADLWKAAEASDNTLVIPTK